MAANLDPSGAPVTVGNVTLVTPGLAGVAESHLPGSEGMRAAEGSTEELDAALASEGLEAQETIELTETVEIDMPAAPARSTAFAEPAIQVEVPAPSDGWGQVLLATDESGVMTWTFALPSEAMSGLRAAGTRTYLVRRHVPEAAAEEAGTRGLIGAIGNKVLKVLAFKLLDKVAGEVSDYFVGRWEQKKRPYRVRAFLPDDFTAPGAPPLDGDGWSRLQGGRALLFVHGTFSRAHTAFGALPRDLLAELSDRYQGRLFAFDHFTLSHEPRQNIEWLVERIPEGAQLELDVVCHSRGALVTRLLAERQAEISLGSRQLVIRKVAFVAAPNAGTILADPTHFGDLVDIYTNILNFFPDTGVVEVLQTVIAVVKQLAVGTLKGLDGLQSMAPGSEFLAALNTTTAADADYCALASNFEPLAPGLSEFVTDRLVDAIFRADNDLVVPTAGVYDPNGSSLFPIERRHVLRDGEAVAHTRYFTSHLAQRKLMEWLAA